MSEMNVKAVGEKEALRWYAENVEGCRKIGSAGDPFRAALDRDGGKRARDAISNNQFLSVSTDGDEAAGRDRWMEWAGGICPVRPETPGFVRVADGDEEYSDDISQFSWSHEGTKPVPSRRIVAYRLSASPSSSEKAVEVEAVYHWHPISIAPRNGTVVWLFQPHDMGGFMFAGAVNADGVWINNLDLRVQNPTYWMPLPDGPNDIERPGDRWLAEIDERERSAVHPATTEVERLTRENEQLNQERAGLLYGHRNLSALLADAQARATAAETERDEWERDHDHLYDRLYKPTALERDELRKRASTAELRIAELEAALGKARTALAGYTSGDAAIFAIDIAIGRFPSHAAEEGR